MGYNPSRTTDNLISFVLFIAIVVGLASTVLVYIGNISDTGIVLGGVATAILGIMFGIFILKGGMKFFKHD